MIHEVSITDLGVIHEARLPLGPGLTALTGETGAGKTMVVTALGLLLGQRADSTQVRREARSTWVEGRFAIGTLPGVTHRAAELGAAIDDGELVLSREVLREGRSRALVGGRSAPVSALSELASDLVVVHGQSDQVRLKSETAQRDALDRFAGPDLKKALEQYREAYEAATALEKTRDMLRNDSEARSAEAQDLREAIADIEAVNPTAGEDATLSAHIAKLTHAEELRQAAMMASQALSADDSVFDAKDALALVDQALKSWERVVSFDSSAEELRSSLADAAYQLSEVSVGISGYLASLESEGVDSLEDSHERLAAVTALMRRHGPTLDDVLALYEGSSTRLLELEQDSDRLATLDAECEQAMAVAWERANALGDIRDAAASKLASAVSHELSALAMPNASLHVSVSREQTLSSHGANQVSLLLAAHPGAEPLPLGKGASGGELSRVMLALEVVIAESDPVPTFVFDEVDAGVGGASALEIGRRLDALAQTSQVIVVTHLAQVAAFANNHLHVVKDTDGQVTTSSVTRLEGEQRLREIARMLGGMEDSHSALTHARELLDQTHSVSRR
ncbi:DNA repair protein RecN [Pontimonas sp.]|nr:DNA repair protein RecN [Pontimonas sp.]MDB4606912.1 DNA repair protein RecN [Pontimonas sp.]